MNASIEENRRIRSRIITYESLEDQIREFLKHDDIKTLNEILLGAHPANIASVLYVLNAADQLIGVVSLRDVVTSDPQQRIEDLMTKELFAVLPEMDQEEAARLVSHYDIVAVPVVDRYGQMLGIVPTDNVIDVLVSESTEDILRFGGMEAGAIDQPYFSIGSVIPMLAYKLNIDPAVVSAPLITTLVDTTGLAIYLLIARAVLGLA